MKRRHHIVTLDDGVFAVAHEYTRDPRRVITVAANNPADVAIYLNGARIWPRDDDDRVPALYQAHDDDGGNK